MKNSIAFLLLFSFFSGYSQAVPEKPTDISPILIGETLPNLPIYDTQNKPVQLLDLVNKPSVIIFYRGGWCPYCNAHLAEMVKIEDKILAKGYQILAISPDDFQNLENTQLDLKMKYSLFSDKNATLIKALGIAFKANDATRNYIKSKNKGEITEVLPVPTVLIVDAKGEVKMQYIRPNITERISGKLLLNILDGLAL